MCAVEPACMDRNAKAVPSWSCSKRGFQHSAPGPRGALLTTKLLIYLPQAVRTKYQEKKARTQEALGVFAFSRGVKTVIRGGVTLS